MIIFGILPQKHSHTREHVSRRHQPRVAVIPNESGWPEHPQSRYKGTLGDYISVSVGFCVCESVWGTFVWLFGGIKGLPKRLSNLIFGGLIGKKTSFFSLLMSICNLCYYSKQILGSMYIYLTLWFFFSWVQVTRNVGGECLISFVLWLLYIIYFILEFAIKMVWFSLQVFPLIPFRATEI